MIRRATLADIPEIIAIAQVAYPHIPFDPEIAKVWLERMIPVQEALVLICQDGVIVVDQVIEWWRPAQPEMNIVFLAVRPGNPTALTGYWLLKNVIGYAEKAGVAVCFGSTTGVDFTPYARRLGAVADAPSFRLETRGGQEGSRAAD